jgi:predicted nucleic acid-binding protein
MISIVIDTNVFVAAMRTNNITSSASRAVLRAALDGKFIPLFGNALWLEYEDLLGRPVWTQSTSPDERLTVMKALAAAGRWVGIYYGWRPNLPDEGDNHLIELAIAGNAQAIVTHNVKGLRRGQLIWPGLRIMTPADCMEEFL